MGSTFQWLIGPWLVLVPFQDRVSLHGFMDGRWSDHHWNVDPSWEPILQVGVWTQHLTAFHGGFSMSKVCCYFTEIPIVALHSAFQTFFPQKNKQKHPLWRSKNNDISWVQLKQVCFVTPSKFKIWVITSLEVHRPLNNKGVHQRLKAVVKGFFVI